MPLQVEGGEEQAQGSVQDSAKRSEQAKTPERSQGAAGDEDDDAEYQKVTELHNELGVVEEKIIKLTKLLEEVEFPDEKTGNLA